VTLGFLSEVSINAALKEINVMEGGLNGMEWEIGRIVDW
jgi:hypothetical protein